MENTKTDKEIKGMQEIIFNTLTIVIKIINYERDISTQIHCKIGKIPPGLIRRTRLPKLIKVRVGLLQHTC